jgi:hypothetical protein
MANAKFVVLTNPVEGREDEYNDWYDNQHLADILATNGITSAQRYEVVAAPGMPASPQRYMAIYEVDGNVGDVLAEMGKRGAEGKIRMSDSLDMSTMSMTVWTARE